jgi:hypothetical protein
MKPKQVLTPHSVKGFRFMHLAGLFAWCFKEKAVQESQKKAPRDNSESRGAFILHHSGKSTS